MIKLPCEPETWLDPNRIIGVRVVRQAKHDGEGYVEGVLVHTDAGFSFPVEAGDDPARTVREIMHALYVWTSHGGEGIVEPCLPPECGPVETTLVEGVSGCVNRAPGPGEAYPDHLIRTTPFTDL